jgi:hypothetical protein
MEVEASAGFYAFELQLGGDDNDVKAVDEEKEKRMSGILEQSDIKRVSCSISSGV